MHFMPLPWREAWWMLGVLGSRECEVHSWLLSLHWSQACYTFFLWTSRLTPAPPSFCKPRVLTRVWMGMKHLPIPLKFASHLLLLWAPCGRPRVRPDFCSRQQPLPPYLAYSDEVPFLVPKLKIIILSKFTSVLLHFKEMNHRTLSRDYFKIDLFIQIKS